MSKHAEVAPKTPPVLGGGPAPDGVADAHTLIVPGGRVVRSRLDHLFRWGIIGKGIYGAVELLLGIVLTLVSTTTLQAWADALTQRELSRDPTDFVSTALVSMVDGLTSSAVLFAAVYLVAHGVVKIGLVTSVLARAFRIYPWAIAVLLAFIGYQVFDLFLSFTVGLLLLTLFDIAIVALTVRDYRRHVTARVSVRSGASVGR